MQGEGEFDWDATTQSTILGSFYWCYILSQVVGGILTQHFGTKTVFGFSQLITAICSLLIPSAAPLHYGAVLWRVGQEVGGKNEELGVRN